MTDRALAIRADAGAGVGAGHVMRSLALADAWRRNGGWVEWFSVEMPPILADLIASRGVAQHLLESPDEWDALCAWARRHSGAWVVVDGYGFAAGPAALQAAGARVLVIDDAGAWPRYDCDVLLNQNCGADAIPYRTTAVSRMCGPAYALIRDEFSTVDRPDRTFDRRAERVLVSFGGHDAHGQAARVIRLLTAIHPVVAIDAVCGVVAQASGRPAGVSVTYHNTTNLAPLMRDADVAVVAAGSICWELCCLGLPALGLIVADNQRAVAEGVDQAGAIRNLGWFDTLDDDSLTDAMTRFLHDPARGEMSRRGRMLVDGQGAHRVLDAMLSVERFERQRRGHRMTAFLSNSMINLRPVRRADLALLAEWRNDPEIRRVTREWRALTEADQEHWFQRISAPERRDHMFVVERTSDALPVGVVGLVHWSPTDGTAEVSFFIGRQDARGQGYARGALTLLFGWGFDVMRLERIVAEVYAFNDESFGLLTSLGFVVEGRMRAHVHRDGRRWDANILGLLRDEWHADDEAATEGGSA